MRSSNDMLHFIPFLLLGLLVLSACASANTGLETDASIRSQDLQVTDLALIAVDEDGATTVEVLDLVATAQSADATTLSETEAVGLQFMREEEKLAQDLYLALYDLWGVPIFNNIASSEATHTEAVKQLLARYGIEDPAQATLPGVFQDPALQDLYDQLLARGSRSLDEALLVGGLVEEVDIQDLEDRVNQTDDSLIENVYANLMAGSQNHLRAFASQYQSRTGHPYSPQYLHENQVNEILATAIESGRRGRSN
jgi:hypothetical protein